MLSILLNNSITKVVDTEIPNCGENEVIINMKMCGLCGTDIEKINGNYKASGITLGHEPVGIIHKKGKNVKGFKIGERVFVHHHVPCYKCHHCLNDSETMCNQYRKTNIEPGGFSEFFKVPQINIFNNGILKLPNHVSFENAMFIEPMACCIRALNKIKVKKTNSYYISGLGSIGLMFLKLLRLEEVDKIFVSDIKNEKLKYAQKIEKCIPINALDNKELDIINQETNNIGVDVAIVATSNMNAIIKSLEVLRKGGKILIFGIPAINSILKYDISRLVTNEISIITSNATTEKDTKLALEYLSNNKIALEDFITHKYNIRDFKIALSTIEKENCIKIAIVN